MNIHYFFRCSGAPWISGEQCVKIKLWHSNCTMLLKDPGEKFYPRCIWGKKTNHRPKTNKWTKEVRKEMLEFCWKGVSWCILHLKSTKVKVGNYKENISVIFEVGLGLFENISIANFGIKTWFNRLEIENWLRILDL